MKTVYFIRHAKSSWSDFSLKDFDRPLNKRGKRDAPFMAEKMKEFGMLPDAIISSPANRAITTATYFANAIGIAPSEIIKESSIYEAYGETVLLKVRQLSENWQTVLVFGHNPAFTMIANSFQGGNLDNVPTCGIVKIMAEVATWNEFTTKKGKLVEFHYPKQYF